MFSHSFTWTITENWTTENWKIQCLVWWAWKLKHFRHVMVGAMLSWHTLDPLVAAQHCLNTRDYQSIDFCMCPSFMAAVYASADGWFQQHTVSLQSRMKIWRFMYKKAPVTLITARLADCCVRVWICYTCIEWNCRFYLDFYDIYPLLSLVLTGN